ncbi:MFS transporter [Streptomyces sp. NPDC002088]|uniref:MFS transporter n=1 Tax=Streptomyces sp. NPDC002088 TaxID=3154665 RepID=UPI0033204E9D
MPNSAAFGHTFAALTVPNFRRYLSGQAVSLTGGWMQGTAQSWLVLTLTHSATLVGVTVAVQTLPVLVLAPYGGVVADRVNKRRMILRLQYLLASQSVILGLMAALGAIRFWSLLLTGLVLGVSSAFENPARQSMLLELVGAKHVGNAVSLYATSINLARVIGPAIAGVLIAAFGVSGCFLINAVSFVPVIVSLARMDENDLRGEPSHNRARSGGLREGLGYVARTPGLAVPLAMMGLVGCLAFEWPVSLPYMADGGLHAGSAGYGFMTAAMSLGSVIGGLVAAGRGWTGPWYLVLSAAGMGIALVPAALAPNLAVELVVLPLVGAGNVMFMSGGNATLQLTASPEMRGRVMALWTVCFQGSTPIGGPLVGAAMSAVGPRAGLGLAAATCLVAAGGGALALRTTATDRPATRQEASSPSVHQTQPSGDTPEIN